MSTALEQSIEQTKTNNGAYKHGQLMGQSTKSMEQTNNIQYNPQDITRTNNARDNQQNGARTKNN